MIICRIFLGISIISFVVMFGCCMACSSAQTGSNDYYEKPDGRLAVGISNESERTYAKFTAIFFGVGAVASFVALFAYNLEVAERKNEQERNG